MAENKIPNPLEMQMPINTMLWMSTSLKHFSLTQKADIPIFYEDYTKDSVRVPLCLTISKLPKQPTIDLMQHQQEILSLPWGVEQLTGWAT